MFKETERAWDVVLTPNVRAQVQDRRLNPEGGCLKVEKGKRGERSYPWRRMQDGDFFITQISSSVEAQKTGLRQAAARCNIEISIKQWYLETASGRTPALRVTRIMGNLALVRYAASLSNPDIPLGFDVKGCAERVREYRKRRREEAAAIGNTKQEGGEDA